jgi:hypothetical protein
MGKGYRGLKFFKGFDGDQALFADQHSKQQLLAWQHGSGNFIGEKNGDFLHEAIFGTGLNEDDLPHPGPPTQLAVDLGFHLVFVPLEASGALEVEG